MAGVVARHLVVFAFFGLGHGPRRWLPSRAWKGGRISGTLVGAAPHYKVKIASPIRMRMITANAHLTSRVNAIQV
jgi:hypothetical protein